MSREVRMVPSWWRHPKDENGHFIPLLGDSFKESVAKWDEVARQWKNGFVRDYATDKWKPRDPNQSTFEEDEGTRPEEADYMPEWSQGVRTHCQMYETTNEGEPISPVLETPEELARWLVENNASAFGNRGATYEQWLATIKHGWAISAIFSPKTGLVSGVEGLHSK